MATVTVSITIPPDLRDRIDAIADTAHVTRSWIITRVMTAWADGIDAGATGGERRDRVIAAAITEALEPAL